MTADKTTRERTVLIYVTFPSLEAAEKLGGELVEQRLAACVNILPGMISIYRWQGKHQRDAEVVMIAKTRESQKEAVIEAVKRRHTYETPAILVLPVEGGSEAYLSWIAAETSTA